MNTKKQQRTRGTAASRRGAEKIGGRCVENVNVISNANTMGSLVIPEVIAQSCGLSPRLTMVDYYITTC